MAKRNILNGRTRRPTHPGELLREDLLPALQLTQEEFARRLGVSRQTIVQLLHEKRSVSMDMAFRLGKFFGDGPDVWIRMQQAIDAWKTLRKNKASYAKIQGVKPAA